MMKFSRLLNHSRLYGYCPVRTRAVCLPHACCSHGLPSSAILLFNAHTLALHRDEENDNRRKTDHKFGCFGGSFFVSGLRPARLFRGRHFCYGPTSMPSIEEEPSTSSYFSVRIQCSREFADMLSEALLCFGASSSSIEDADDSENLDVDDSANLDKVLITSIFTDGEAVNKCISLASSSIGMKEVPSFEVKKCEQRDWIKNFEETFHPVKITDSFWVIPQWTGPQDVHATNIILNPGLAFGTGEHPTTKLCLLLLNEVVAGGENVLDYGTGSGVLGISAIKLGAAYSLGVDVDPQAILSASQNATLNNIGPDKLQLYLTTCKVPPSLIDSMHERDKKGNPYIVNFIQRNVQYDIVVANIILNPLLELAEKITSYAKSGGTVGISGFLVEQIEECYSTFLENMSITEMDGWVCVRGTKKL
ncbi:uncharacterized protein LOC116264841 isoform X2 [Nymphaea colorata]|uniref:uncharacterized protein LOC116264841 isoform X2 n=1 Tax=Nymphaea colorata TaxID=210225 RepID=UPI00129E5F7F|nr:uncharacterized protein LOC116264841 isoform X2 [Nymphaea colorata]